MYNQFSCLFYYNERSKIYLKFFRKKKIIFKNIFIYGEKCNEIFYPYAENIFYFNNNFLNFEILNKILTQKCTNLIFSGGNGEIVKKNFIKKLNLYHAHPGKLPQTKGSCAIYYSLIEYKKVYCSILKLSKTIDDGKIFLIKKFKNPNLDKVEYNSFDNKIRAKTLVQFILSKKIKPKKKNIKNNFKYYIPHPIIRALNYSDLKKQILKNIKSINLDKEKFL